MNGIVKFYDAGKGYGFVTPLTGGGAETPAVYFHVSAVCRPEKGFLPGLPSGCEVTFDLVRSARGVQGANVRLVKLSGALLAPPLPIKEQLERFRARSIKTRSAENVV